MPVGIWCLAATVLVMDQATKLGAGERALGNPELLLGIAAPGRIGGVVLAAVVLATLGPWFVGQSRSGRVPPWATGLLLGGALGNLTDRVVLGTVRDFIVVGGIVVNVADVALLVGATVATVALWRARPSPA